MADLDLTGGEAAVRARARVEMAALQKALADQPPELWMETILQELATLRARTSYLTSTVLALETRVAVVDILLPDSAAVGAENAYPAEVVIPANEHLTSEDNFYGLEHDNRGQPFRWTGPGNIFTLSFFVDRSEDRIFNLQLSGAILPALLETVTCYEGAKKIPLVAAQLDSDHIYTGALEKAGKGRTTLRFAIEETRSPQELGFSEDSRPLGVCFRRLTVEEAPPAEEEEPTVGAVAASAKPAAKPKPKL